MEQDFDFGVYVFQLIDSEEPENTIKNLIKAKDKYSSEENEEFLFNMVSTYINGDIEKEHTKKAVKEISELVNNEETQNSIHMFFTSWLKYFVKKNTQEQYNIFDKIISNIEPKSYNFTKFIWSFQELRNLIQYAPIHKSGQDYAFNGRFRTLFSNNCYNYETQKCLESVNDLINDTSILHHVIKYVHHIIKLNETYISTYFTLNIKVKKCSYPDFNIFILKFLHKLYTNYFINKNKNELFDMSLETSNKQSITLQVKEYEIFNLTLPQQIYVTMLYGVHVLLEGLCKMYDEYRENQTNTMIRMIKKLVSEEWIQDLYIEYRNFYQYFHIEDIFIDMFRYIDFILTYNKKDKLNIKIKDDHYVMLSIFWEDLTKI